MDLRKRITTAEARSGGGGRSSRAPYNLSSAAAAPILRKLRGTWRVVEHTVGGEPYLLRHSARVLRGATLEEASYLGEYEFREGLCLKLLEIRGILAGEGGGTEYLYRLRVASTWDLDGVDSLAITPELGYQYTSLGGAPAALKELDDPRDLVYVTFRFEGSALVIEEGEDCKRLERLP